MLEQMIIKGANKLIETKYQHIKLPSVVYSKVTKVQDATGYYVYNLKILDENKEIDTRFPEIPKVKSTVALEYGDICTVVLLYGQLNIHIVGKVI